MHKKMKCQQYVNTKHQNEELITKIMLVPFKHIVVLQ